MRPRDLLLKLTAASLCHSDVLYKHGMAGPIPSEGRIIGHESAGIVVAVRNY